MPKTVKRQQQLYIVPVSAREPRARADRFAMGGVDAVALLGADVNQAEDSLVELTGRVDPDRIHVWAIRASNQLRGTWSRIEPGDWFLFVSRGRIFGLGRVGGTSDSRVVASALWGRTDGSEFRLLVAFDRVTKLDVPAWNYRTVIGGRFIGFRRLSDDFRGTLIRKFGSVQDFVEKELTRAHEAAAKEAS